MILTREQLRERLSGWMLIPKDECILLRQLYEAMRDGDGDTAEATLWELDQFREREERREDSEGE